MCDNVVNDMKDATIVRLFSRQRLSATVIAKKDVRIVGGTPVKHQLKLLPLKHLLKHLLTHLYQVLLDHDQELTLIFRVLPSTPKEFEQSGGVYFADQFGKKI